LLWCCYCLYNHSNLLVFQMLKVRVAVTFIWAILWYLNQFLFLIFNISFIVYYSLVCNLLLSILFFICLFFYTGIWWYIWRPQCLRWLQTGFNSCCAYYWSHHWQKDALLGRNGWTWKFIRSMWYVIQLHSYCDGNTF